MFEILVIAFGLSLDAFSLAVALECVRKYVPSILDFVYLCLWSLPVSFYALWLVFMRGLKFDLLNLLTIDCFCDIELCWWKNDL